MARSYWLLASQSQVQGRFPAAFKLSTPQSFILVNLICSPPKGGGRKLQDGGESLKNLIQRYKLYSRIPFLHRILLNQIF
jgi:hypothetical protein